MDVTGRDGACAAEPCFAGTPEAVWLAAHAAEHGFVIRYPEGAEAITGYLHEPWHLRYVGVGVATDLVARGLTLDEYLA
jgi:D-alanyl-D-alanine carboxypeptidase